MKKQDRQLPSVSPWIVWPAVVLATATGLAAAVLLWLKLLPLGDPLLWIWKQRETLQLPFPWTVPAVVVLLVIALLALDTLRSGKHPRASTCAWMVVCLTVATGTLMTTMITDEPEYPVRAAASILGYMSMGYYQEATRVTDVRQYLADVPGRTTFLKVPERVGTHPPGPVLLFRAAREWLMSHPATVSRLEGLLQNWAGGNNLRNVLSITQQFAGLNVTQSDLVMAYWTGVLLTFVAPLVVPLAFALGALAADLRTGLASATLATAVPAILCFNPSVDALSAVVACGVLALGLWSLRSWSGVAGLLAGALLMVGMFWTFGLMALAAVLLVQWLLALRGPSVPSGRLQRLAPVIGAALGMVLVGVAEFVFLSYNPVTSMSQSMALQRFLMSTRSYLSSVPWNLYDVVLFAGPALVVVAVWGTVLAHKGEALQPRVAALGIGLAVTFLLLLVGGQTRGEVGRIWGFLMVPLVVPASIPILGLRDWGLMSAGTLVLAAQLALVVSLNCCLRLVSLW